MIITPKTTLEEIKNIFPNQHWGLNKVNGILEAIKASENFDVNLYEDNNGKLMIYINERINA
jgi:hypothetical protein